MNKLAPILFLVYNRPVHTRKTVEALKKNELASQSELFICSDGAKNDDALQQVKEVRDYIKTIEGFKKITIIEQDKNIGLSRAMISGVTKVVNEYGKIIVLEDDINTSPYFLKFMNEALEFYKDKDKVWHVSGWCHPIDTDNLEDAFLWRCMNCWGWATWADKWRYFEKNPDNLVSTWKKDDIDRFNLDGTHDFWSQVTQNRDGIIDSWAIFWYATIFSRQGLCVNPFISQVENIGFDGSGENCISSIDQQSLNTDKYFKNFTLPSDYIENYFMVEQIKRYYLDQLLIKNRIFKKIKKILNFIQHLKI